MADHTCDAGKDLLAAVCKVKDEFGRAFLKSGQGTPAHALGGVPNASRFVASSNFSQVSALAAAQIHTVNLKR